MHMHGVNNNKNSTTINININDAMAPPPKKNTKQTIAAEVAAYFSKWTNQATPTEGTLL